MYVGPNNGFAEDRGKKTETHSLVRFLESSRTSNTENCLLFSKTACLQQLVASSLKPAGDVGSEARVRDASERLLDVLPGRVLVQSERRVGRSAEVDGTDARRVRPYVESVHDGDEEFANRFHYVLLNASRHVDHEYHVVDVPSTRCTKHILAYMHNVINGECTYTVLSTLGSRTAKKLNS